ncbi:hypothetical protein LLE49_11765 [Alicyclobacillus tolerans]|uniref:hypothetical protein n=1 Tax=Alicyclobacillus tolerans TaxID=90970 RepID=UPI001F3369AC|nr:hypothetical protein [Alicyclobacillus tolerans]MCF8565393.1 hypothetical protein [Alicyclobacillus tolerans]
MLSPPYPTMKANEPWYQNEDIMGVLTNWRIVTVLSTACAVVIVYLQAESFSHAPNIFLP